MFHLLDISDNLGSINLNLLGGITGCLLVGVFSKDRSVDVNFNNGVVGGNSHQVNFLFYINCSTFIVHIGFHSIVCIRCYHTLCINFILHFT